MIARILLVFVAGLVGAGCFKWELVRPTELPKISRVTVGNVVRGPSAGKAVAVSIIHMKRPDGRLLEVSGRPTVRITDVHGKQRQFKHPIQAKLHNGRMIIDSGNRPRTIYRMQDIQHVGVRKVSGWSYFWLAFGAFIVPAIVTTVIVARPR
jgi:hypothetical protein